MTTTPMTATERQAIGEYIAKKIIPHPDGKPWAKCCTYSTDSEFGCQCFMKKPAENKSRYEACFKQDPTFIKMVDENGRFFCCHRSTDDGFHRECAGWAAKITGNRP